MKNKKQNCSKPQHSLSNVANAYISIFKPLCEGDLSKLKKDICNEQFNRFDEDSNNIEQSSGEVLKALQSLHKNPKLCDYVLKCLTKNDIHIIPNKMLVVIVEKPIYDSNPKSSIALLRMKENNPKYTLNIILQNTFGDIGEVESFVKNIENFPEERIHFDDNAFMLGLTMRDLLFEKYSIREIGI